MSISIFFGSSDILYLDILRGIKAFYCNFTLYNTLFHTCIYNRPPQDEPSGSKHVEYIID
jgi:hypothetical protein